MLYLQEDTHVHEQKICLDIILQILPFILKCIICEDRWRIKWMLCYALCVCVCDCMCACIKTCDNTCNREGAAYICITASAFLCTCQHACAYLCSLWCMCTCDETHRWVMPVSLPHCCLHVHIFTVFPPPTAADHVMVSSHIHSY